MSEELKSVLREIGHMEQRLSDKIKGVDLRNQDAHTVIKDNHEQYRKDQLEVFGRLNKLESAKLPCEQPGEDGKCSPAIEVNKIWKQITRIRTEIRIYASIALACFTGITASVGFLFKWIIKHVSLGNGG